jgi:hypothetical protein
MLRLPASRCRRDLHVLDQTKRLLDCSHDLLAQIAAELVPAALAPAAIAGVTLLEAALAPLMWRHVGMLNLDE